MSLSHNQIISAIINPSFLINNFIPDSVGSEKNGTSAAIVIVCISAASLQKAVAEYTYNELCFVMDNYYGRPSKATAASYLEKMDFDQALDEISDETRKAKKAFEI